VESQEREFFAMKTKLVASLLGLFLSGAVTWAQSPEAYAQAQQEDVMRLLDFATVANGRLTVWSSGFSPENREAVQRLLGVTQDTLLNGKPIFDLDSYKARLDIGVSNTVFLYAGKSSFVVHILPESKKSEVRSTENNPENYKNLYFSYLSKVNQFDTDITDFQNAKTWKELTRSAKDRILRSVKAMSEPNIGTLKTILNEGKPKETVQLVFVSDIFIRGTSGPQGEAMTAVRMIPQKICPKKDAAL
jgi:hypothetical protein